MSVSAVFFYLISAVILGSGILAVTTRKIFRSAIYLLGSLVGIAGLYFWLEVEFIAAVQVIVYVGGIVVLILFSIFLTQQSGREMPATHIRRNIAAIFASVFGFSLAALLIYEHEFTPVNVPFDSGVERIGYGMLSGGEGGYALPFEVVSILLLAAMVGCIVIAIKSAPQQR